MPDPLSNLLSALTGRKRNAPGEISSTASENTQNALSALLDNLLSTVGDNLGGTASGIGGAVADRAGRVGGQISSDARNIGGGLRSGFNALPLVPDIGGGNRNPGKIQGPEGSRISLSPAEIAGLVAYQPVPPGQALRKGPSTGGRKARPSGNPNKNPRNINPKTAKSGRSPSGVTLAAKNRKAG